MFPFVIPSPPIPPSELHLIPRPLPARLKYALEELRLHRVKMTEFGLSLANLEVTFHWGNVSCPYSDV